ncbi:putative transport protein [Parabacteroides sp. PF5-5]|uniref:aspartate-alanine antiporter n=1 Tax=unclassified Parabacteroides TaxID=2649774 RepID=UPI002476DDB7|nr:MULTISPECIES: aspartate-alanine antiporter [unclassified Parabacteroides]MDH6303891.1 putative transport protein [Parabacteroides sp. PH5-39]MDH6314508.1 putative transport protein [Parabacteroides sp. PF5-13]MDH6318427.1 putative transport protein [Parabacteroides sp. PH5-13]MDH6322280.1 putative transport protein [Parabacteroides sp. PH5-8]MDH6325640.1 putative transport protein [Parabacteroides sp. PH5-41]
MEWITQTLQNTPELAIFLTLALGFAIGQIKIKGFSLGSVTGVLLMGVLVGQLDIVISPTVKSTFFLIFLFAVGYSVGPQFIHGLKKDGLPQILFSVIVCVACLVVAWIAAWIAGFDIGNAAGLLAGANTISAVIGVATDTINQLSIDEQQKQTLINQIPVAYAVTYIFGTAGTAWFLASLGPKILGGDIKKQTKEYEASLGGSIVDNDPTLEYAYDGTTFRVIEVNNSFFDKPKSVEELEQMLLQKGWPVYVERIRKADNTIIQEPVLLDLIHKGDRIVLNGPLDALLQDEDFIGTEVADLELLDFRAEALRVIVSNKSVEGLSLGSLRKCKDRHGVIIRKIHRGRAEVPLLKSVKLMRGDVVEIEGRKTDVDRFAKFLGYAERPTNATDLLYVGLGIFIGGMLGTLTLRIGNVPLSLSASGGVLILGIIFGWLRSLRPTFGAIPEPAVWLMNNMGLNIFIAVVGITAGPDFIAGLKASGVSLFIAGIFVSLVPMFIGLLLGKYVFKFPSAITLGACAGARTTTAALGAITEAIDSKVPSLSYTTTYAIGNTLLIIWGVVIVLLMS